MSYQHSKGTAGDAAGHGPSPSGDTYLSGIHPRSQGCGQTKGAHRCHRVAYTLESCLAGSRDPITPISPLLDVRLWGVPSTVSTPCHNALPSCAYRFGCTWRAWCPIQGWDHPSLCRCPWPDPLEALFRSHDTKPCLARWRYHLPFWSARTHRPGSPLLNTARCHSEHGPRCFCYVDLGLAVCCLLPRLPMCNH